MNRDTWRHPNDIDVMYASTYAIDEKWSAVFLRLHTSAFDRVAAVALLKELMRLVAVKGGGDDGGEAKGGDKVNLVVALHK
ncbi:GATA zinc finger domain-containing protein C1393.08 [Trifolium medium]|uniref:GATA zinc finger domain-containing protein C1393.08 n=1 Tax=Trifolium medium TaxID=97028 RepID=A0A392M3W2_9FABA|nr:GATA zinc finger domain-containing protein C1393.08 [Trifolium medium]